MNKKEAVNIINELTSLSIQLDGIQLDGDQPCKSFNLESTNVTFIGLDNIVRYQDGLEQLYLFNKDLEQTLSIKLFENKLITLIKEI